MLHYNVWFDLKADVPEAEAITTIRLFLDQLRTTNQIAGYNLLRNAAVPPKTTLLPFQAIIEFQDGKQFSTAFSDLRQAGIHNGPHGVIVEMVTQIRAEVFNEV
jgi:hypothetical protein